jgi:O-antigen/teichoic acid export membrane protein
MPARTYFAVLEGTQRFTWFQACEMIRLVSQIAMFAAVLILDLSIAWLGAALAASSLVALVAARVAAHRVMPELDLSPRAATRPELRRLVGYGGGLVVLRLTSTLFRQMDKVIIAASLGPSSVTVYEIANKIQAAALMVQSVAASALVPAVAFARQKVEILQDMFLRGSAYSLAVTLPFVGAVGIFAEPLIRTWIDPKYTTAASATRLFAVLLLLSSFLVVGITMAVALGHLRFFIALNVPILLVNLLVSVLLVGPLGIDGVVLGSVIAYAIGFPIQVAFLLRRFEIGVWKWVRHVIVPNLPGAAVQAATAVPLLALAADVHTVVEAGLIALVSIGLSIATYLLVGLSRDNRNVLIGTVRDALGLSR